MSNKKNWQINALLYLDDYELGKCGIKLTQKDLAKAAGVSRQTVWRDPEIVTRFKKLAAEKTSKNGKSRKDSEMLQRSLRKEIETLQEANNKLLHIIMLTAKSLRNAGIDPTVHIPNETASFPKTKSFQR